MNLNHKIALVTGSTSGIGAATVETLAGEGAHVIVAGRDEARGRSVVESIRAEGGTADFIAAALRDESSARALATAAVEIAGRVDILVNDAGIGAFGPTASTTEEQFDEMYSVNVKVPFFLVAALAPAMAQRGEGVIVNVSTMVAGFGQAGAALYGSSKAGDQSADQGLGRRIRSQRDPDQRRIPGPTRTEGTEFMGDALDQQAAGAPAGRVASPQEIANTIFLDHRRRQLRPGRCAPGRRRPRRRLNPTTQSSDPNCEAVVTTTAERIRIDAPRRASCLVCRYRGHAATVDAVPLTGEAVTISTSPRPSRAGAIGHREPRERRRRQMPAPARRQGSRRAIQETPYSP